MKHILIHVLRVGTRKGNIRRHENRCKTGAETSNSLNALFSCFRDLNTTNIITFLHSYSLSFSFDCLFHRQQIFIEQNRSVEVPFIILAKQK